MYIVRLPHARGGVSQTADATKRQKDVFPTHVGVFLDYAKAEFPHIRLPHARGGVSPSKRISKMVHTVFPTHVGVFPASARPSRRHWRLPHARGGVSHCPFSCFQQGLSSPRTWGCFSRATASGAASGVFPTHVGVFLIVSFKESSGLCLPHARGGVSDASSMLLA